MKKFEVLCVTMHQKDFGLFEKMNMASNAVFANQADALAVEEEVIDGYEVKMVSTSTRGVGVNRNISLLAATAEICLMADDDIVYRNGYADAIINEFDKHPEADVIIFNIGCLTPQFGRIPTVINKFKRFTRFSRNPFGAPRVAFRLSSLRKANVMFSQLFGGGCIYPFGEDTVWIESMLKAGLKIYLSPVFIGDVAYEESSWFDSSIEKKLYGYGAMLCGKKTSLWQIYMLRYAFKMRHKISIFKACVLISNGYKGFKKLVNFEEYKNRKEKI